MKCNPDMLLLFSSGELKERDAENVRAHIGECSLCRAELNNILEVSESVAGLSPLPVAESIVSEALNIGQKDSAWVTWLKASFSPAYVAGFVTTLMALVMLLQREPSPNRSGETILTYEDLSFEMRLTKIEDEIGSLAARGASFEPDSSRDLGPTWDERLAELEKDLSAAKASLSEDFYAKS